VRRTIDAALVALALIGPPLAALPAAAQVRISIDPGAVAFAYSDGYWDRDHRWHGWANDADRKWYQAHYAGHYYDHQHDHDHGGGWRDDRWWEHH
jgi:hypothetical protein